MAFLVDTSVVLELRNGIRCHPNVAAWQAGIAGEAVFISVISMMEIQNWILSARLGNAALAELLEEWFQNQLKPAFDGRILDIDLPIAEQCARMLQIRTRDLAATLIAATAQVHGLTLATHNTADFQDTGILLSNPWIVS